MQPEYKTTGILNIDGTLKIEGYLPVAPGRVELVIRPLSDTKKVQSIWDIIGKSTIERPKADIDEQIKILRDEWEES
jgi:hypothetical protein